MNQQKHEMILEKTHSSGAEEWNCPSCGRRLLINWEPPFKKIILEAGDKFSIHSGGKGGLRIGSTEITSMKDQKISEAPEIHTEEARLAPWEAWLDESGFEDLWGDDND